KTWGRLYFHKPPLLFWLSALSVKLLGISLFAIRLPAMLAGAACASAVFLWCAKYRSPLEGALGAAMLVTCPIALTLSRLVYTDMLCAACITIAMTAVALDPELRLLRTSLLLGAFTGAAILAKSVAGLLPLMAVGAFWIVIQPKHRPPFLR